MNDVVKKHHMSRRPFVIVPEVGILLGQKDLEHSHVEMLLGLGLKKDKVQEIIDNYPRGFFMDNRLVIYQGDNVVEGCNWELNEENFDLVRKFFADLKNIFPFDSNTKIFLGVKCGELGTVWEHIKEVGLDFFE